jgi:hypothetical protein
MIGTGMAILRYWPWAAGLALALALAWFGWTVKGWQDKAARVDAAEQALQDERADRAHADLARLAASMNFNVKIDGYNDRTTILRREIVRYVSDDRPCLPQVLVDELNRGRK